MFSQLKCTNFCFPSLRGQLQNINQLESQKFRPLLTYYLSIDYALHILPHQVKRNSFFRESECFFNWKVNEDPTSMFIEL